MKSPPKGAADALTSSADYFTMIQRELLKAKNERDRDALGRAGKLIDADAFRALPDEAQDDLIALFGAAMVAGGVLSP